jgi:hypothetical protein
MVLACGFMPQAKTILPCSVLRRVKVSEPARLKLTYPAALVKFIASRTVVAADKV